MEGCGKQLFFLKALLNSFSLSTGLRVNFQKSMMVPINTPESRLQHLAATFGCSTGSLPFTYLGLPLGITKPKIEEFLPLVTRCERRLISTSIFLSQAERLQITNSVFTSLPTFFMCTFSLHVTIRDQIDKYRKLYLLRGSEDTNRINAKAAWPLVTRPKEDGGLGVLDLKTQNEALLMKNLHKFFNKADIPWVHLIWEKHYGNGKLPSHVRKGSFWWKDILKLLDGYKGLASVSVKSGDTCLLWDDLWQGHVPRMAFPELYSYTRSPAITLLAAKNSPSIESLFSLPISIEAFGQLQLLNNAVNAISVSEENDSWSYIWGSHNYSSKKVYHHLKGSSNAHPVFKWLWKSSCQHKCKAFFWLLIQDRLSS
jgi:hypothetical protein